MGFIFISEVMKDIAPVSFFMISSFVSICYKGKLHTRFSLSPKDVLKLNIIVLIEFTMNIKSSIIVYFWIVFHIIDNF
jgi:hypothetical protein